VFQPGVSRLLFASEVSGEQPDRHADPADQVSEGELEKSEIAPRADAGNGDDRERRGLGGDDREQDRPGGEIPRAEEVVGRAPLMPGDPQPDPERKDEVQADDDDVEGMQTEARLWSGDVSEKREA
jgi:hypothetical protein